MAKSQPLRKEGLSSVEIKSVTNNSGDYFLDGVSLTYGDGTVVSIGRLYAQEDLPKQNLYLTVSSIARVVNRVLSEGISVDRQRDEIIESVVEEAKRVLSQTE